MAGGPWLEQVFGPPHGHWRALYQGGFKLLWNSQGEHRLHDLSRDPAERDNLYRYQRVTAASMSQLLERRIAETPPAPRPAEEPRTVDAETREALRRLGTLE